MSVPTREAARVDLRLTTNADTVLTFAMTDGATPPGPIDLTGIRVHAQIRPDASDLTVLMSLDGEGFATISDAAAGAITIAIPAAAAARVGVPHREKPIAAWDLLLCTDAPQTVRVIEGDVFLFPGVTR